MNIALTQERFAARYRSAILAQKRRSQLYERILNVVENKIEQEALINKLTIAKAIGVDEVQVGNIINTHRALSRIICQHQRKHGSTFTQRRYIQGPFIPCNL